MSPLIVYSSAPVSTQLAVAFQGLKAQGYQVHLRPLSELPAPTGAPQRQQCRRELQRACLHLAAIGDALSAHEAGTLQLALGQEQGLRAERDALLARKRGLERRLAARKGDPARG